MIGQREYMSHRRAYTPRSWPMVIPLVVVVAAAIIVLNPPAWLAALGSSALGGAVVYVRWAIWRHRHPIITVQEHMDDIRSKARWN